MYSDKGNVNILTALLVAHGVRHAVVCPGSRNAPIVHNLNECPHIACYPVTDERSAGFYAVGMMQALHEPVVVCVTSGTALLNLAPAVAEAWYQHLPLVVVSADRPEAWIDQLDGQTLPQPGAFGRFVRRAVSLPETDSWHCNRLVNETLLDALSDDPRPVHINVPITEPLFTFDVPQLPAVRQVVRTSPMRDYDCLSPEFVDGLVAARRPVIVFGQTSPHDFEGIDVDFLFSHVIVLHEALSPFPHVSHFDEVLYGEEQRGGASASPLAPDFIIHVGNTVVSKRLRHFLRAATDAQTWRISPSGDVEDTFQNLRGIIVGDPESVLQSLSHKISTRKLASANYRRQWLTALTQAARHAADYQPAYSQMAAVKCFEEKLSSSLHPSPFTLHDTPFTVHYANSTAIRLANIYASHHVWCNRGVNGIEGSLSTAAGFSVVAHLSSLHPSPSSLHPAPFTLHDSPFTLHDSPFTLHDSPFTLHPSPFTFCIIGDLSFFYDQNALWNQNLRGNLRILLLNNGRGGIFNLLPGLEKSPARDPFVAASHHTTAEGICRQNNIVYLKAETMEQLHEAIDTLLYIEADRPVLLEVLTDAHTDEQVFKDYYRSINRIYDAKDTTGIHRHTQESC